MPDFTQSYYHRSGTDPLRGETIPIHCTAVAKHCAEHEAIVSLHQNRRLAYGELGEQIDQLARGLLSLGFRRGDRIGIWSTNNIAWLLLQMVSSRAPISRFHNTSGSSMNFR